MGDQVSSVLDSGIQTLVIQRPDQRNTLNGAVISKLREAVREACSDRVVRVVAITGAGEHVFCAGADLKSLQSGGETGETFDPSHYRALLLEILRCPKPTVALARGHVLAGGLGLLLACDFALACDDVYFSTPEIHVGMFPMMVLALLYRQVGKKKAAEMLFLGERVPAEAAKALGIVNHVYARPLFDLRAKEFACKLAQKSSRIVGLGKEAILNTIDRRLPEDLEYLESMLSRVMSSSDSREGIRAFLEKRDPIWQDE